MQYLRCPSTARVARAQTRCNCQRFDQPGLTRDRPCRVCAPCLPKMATISQCSSGNRLSHASAMGRSPSGSSAPSAQPVETIIRIGYDWSRMMRGHRTADEASAAAVGWPHWVGGSGKPETSRNKEAGHGTNGEYRADHRRCGARTGLSKVEAKKAVQALLEAVSERLGTGERVQLSGLGSFDVRERAARQATNPRTKQKIQVAASKTVGFRPASALRGRVGGS